ncbi:unannotated protein [freshwater metagenome]|uniref:Unannotated protein n=1 Tax=freshwater metagenome TaxID=449393 RepID=A0A6J7XQ66_9ZZZZ|nr:hypothetical protein [Actinomycetota bacterium]
MFARTLWVSFTQAVRSAVVLFLPIAFITLIAWAIAGSSNGDSSDPVRASVWIWLAAHHIPFSLSFSNSGPYGLLSYLPIGALVFPFFTIRNGFARTIERLDGDTYLVKNARFLFALGYGLISTGLAFGSASTSVTPIWYFAPIFSIPFAFLTCLTVGRRMILTQALNLATRIFALMLGVSSIGLAGAIFLHIQTIENLTRVLQPGIFGGILLLLLNVLYLPNAAIATMSYFSGVGFSMGDATIISPLSFQLPGIPGLPILGALPATTQHFALLGAVIFILAGVVLTSWANSLSSRVLWQGYFLAIVCTALMGFLASGQLIIDSLGTVGVSLWKFPLAISVELLIGILGALIIPKITLPRRSIMTRDSRD